jgi:hypothetical protein
VKLLHKKIKRLSPLNILFLIPLIPHFNLIEDFIHTDDIPVLVFIILAAIRITTIFRNFTPIRGYLFIDLFIFYLFVQNIYLGNGLFNNEIIRFMFYAFIFFFILGNNMESFYENLPVYLFFLCSSFSIISYITSINLGTDLYNNWNIGLNLSDIDYIKGRVNGFQAGGPNSFADLIAITGIYTIFKLDDSYFPYISTFAILGCFFTYSRFSLIVLVIFITLRAFSTESKIISLGIVFVSVLVCANFGLIERFSNDDNSGIQDRVEMSTGTMEYFLEDTLSNNLFGRGHNSFIVSGNEIIKSGSFDKNTVSYGPHNSYLFIILNYGVVGLILYLLIFKNIIVYTFKLKTVFNLSPHFYVVAAFFVLSFSSDLLQNHSISWYLYLSSFLLMREIQNDGSLEV